jgi:hypothetical protein
MRASRLIGFEHVPDTPERTHRKAIAETYANSSPSFSRSAVESYRWFRVGMAGPTLARLACLDVVLL